MNENKERNRENERKKNTFCRNWIKWNASWKLLPTKLFVLVGVCVCAKSEVFWLKSERNELGMVPVLCSPNKKIGWFICFVFSLGRSLARSPVNYLFLFPLSSFWFFEFWTPYNWLALDAFRRCAFFSSHLYWLCAFLLNFFFLHPFWCSIEVAVWTNVNIGTRALSQTTAFDFVDFVFVIRKTI